MGTNQTYGLNKLLSTVCDKESFLIFIDALRAQLDAASSEDDWPNLDLRDYLEAMRAWVSDWEQPADANPWQHAAVLLLVAKIYE